MRWIFNSRLTSSSTNDTFYRSTPLNKYSAMCISMQCFGNDDDTSSRPTTSWGRPVGCHAETFSIFTFIKDKLDWKKQLSRTLGRNSNIIDNFWILGIGLELAHKHKHKHKQVRTPATQA